jgi:hypothetical protein
MIQQPQQFLTMGLGGPCLQQLPGLLPLRRSMLLRQCSKALQYHVNATRGIALSFAGNSKDANQPEAAAMLSARQHAQSLLRF